MKSTDHNLNNPTSVDLIDLIRSLNPSKYPMVKVKSVSQNFYDLIPIKDPWTIYIIEDAEDKRIYFGDSLILSPKTDLKYFISQNDNDEYVIYMNHKRGYDDHLIEICKYDNPNTAIEFLNVFTKMGSHDNIDMKLYTIIVSYIEKDISVHDLLIGILCIFGYQGNPDLQNIIETAFCNGVKPGTYTEVLPYSFSDKLWHYKNLYSKSLFPYYSNLYDLIVKYNFFRGNKYQKDTANVDLKNVIKDIHDIMKK